MSSRVTGSCLCGEVEFSCRDEFTRFYQCHCKQCQQLTGSAYAANLFTAADNIEWLAGADLVETFTHTTRDFSKAFCRSCGSALPFVTKSASALIVPAGSLRESASIQLSANIFTAEAAPWHIDASEVDNFDGFPE